MGQIRRESLRDGAAENEVGEESEEVEEVEGLRHQQIQPWERVILVLSIRRRGIRRLHASLLNRLGFFSTMPMPMPPPASSTFGRRQTCASEPSTTTASSFSSLDLTICRFGPGSCRAWVHQKNNLIGRNERAGTRILAAQPHSTC